MRPPELVHDLADVIAIHTRTRHTTTTQERHPVNVVEQMMAALPARSGGRIDGRGAIVRECIEVLGQAGYAATACADACLDDEMVDVLVGCIATLHDTADVCQVTVRVLARHAARTDELVTRALLVTCLAACRAGREMCEEFLPIHDHCRIGAAACLAAEQACSRLLATLPPPPRPPADGAGDGTGDDCA